MRFPMTNKEYIDFLDKVDDSEILTRILKTMEKYGENNWWCSKDKRELGYMQLHEDTLLISFNEFHQGIEKLLNRPVWTHELGTNFEQLKQEAKEAWEGGENYFLTSEEIENRISKGIGSLVNYCKETNKPLLIIDPTQ